MKKYFLISSLISLILIGAIFLIFILNRQTPNNNAGFDYRGLIASFNDKSGQIKPIKNTKIIFGGDVMLGRSVEITSRQNENFNYPFLGVVNYLNSADIVLVNLENPIVENCPARDSGLTFCANPEMLEGLNYSGINVVNLANNHINNYGESGIVSTRKFLAINNIGHTGLGELYVTLVNGVRFGFLGFNRAESFRSLTDTELKLVSESRKNVDVLIVAMHWGNEYYDKANAYQRETARILVENGADVIVGHHPHWVQDWEKINDTPVYYSLGNFVFDQMWSEKTRQGMLVELTFQGDEIIEQKFVDTYIDQLGQPVLMK